MTAPRVDDSVEWQWFDDEIVAFHPYSKQYFTLNATAARIFLMCDGSSNVDAIVREVGAGRGRGPVRDDDVRETIDGLTELGLLTR